jgi:hypothetical protein
MKKDKLVKEHGEELVNEVFTFLDELRESGDTNMYGASPYIEDEFDMKRRAGAPFLSSWMESYK